MFIFLPSVISIKREQKGIFNLFSLVPKTDVNKVVVSPSLRQCSDRWLFSPTIWSLSAQTLQRLQRNKQSQVASRGWSLQSASDSEPETPEGEETRSKSGDGGEAAPSMRSAGGSSKRSRLSLQREKKFEVSASE